MHKANISLKKCYNSHQENIESIEYKRMTQELGEEQYYEQEKIREREGRKWDFFQRVVVGFQRVGG